MRLSTCLYEREKQKKKSDFFHFFTLLWWVKYCDTINITDFFKEFVFGKKTVFLLEIGGKICIFN